MVVEKLLCKKGYLIVCTKSGEEAISTYKNALATGELFFIVLIDLTISEGMGGVETVQIIKQLDPSSKTVVFTGYSSDPIVEDYKIYGFDGVLKKPFSLDEFEILVNTFRN
jgi:CheY-like chemotaxis protein